MAKNSDADEKELVARSKAGDEEAFRILVEQNREFLTKKAGGLLPEDLKSEVNDVTQLTFIKAWRALAGFKYEGSGAFRGWLAAICTNICLDKARKVRRERPTNDVDSFMWEVAFEKLAGEDKLDGALTRVGGVLANMKYDCRILLVAKLVYGLAPVHIARVAQQILDDDEKPPSFRAWLGTLFEPLGSQIKDRSDYCWKKFKEEISPDASARSSVGTKRESRGGKAAQSEK